MKPEVKAALKLVLEDFITEPKTLSETLFKMQNSEGFDEEDLRDDAIELLATPIEEVCSEILEELKTHLSDMASSEADRRDEAREVYAHCL